MGMDVGPLLLFVVVATALAFAFSNGFHDTANAMATSIVTGALRPHMAVALAAALNFVGAFLSLKVAATIAERIVDGDAITLTVVFAGLLGGLVWNLVTWYFGLPSSSSHALIGGVVGATLVSAGTSAVHGQKIVSDVLVPAVFAPLAAVLVAATGTYLVYRITGKVSDRLRDRGFRVGQIGSASLVSLAHGGNDAQNTMGVITLALIASGAIGDGATVPTWVIVSSAAAMALGTYVGGWRIIRTVGKGLMDIASPQGFAAEASSAAMILAASNVGFPLATTHVCCGSILGSGLGRRRIRWGLASRMAAVWLITLPASALVGAAAWKGTQAIGGFPGVAVMFVVAMAFALEIYVAADMRPVNASNVNAEWTEHGTPPTYVQEPEPGDGTAQTGEPAQGKEPTS
ncbi:inorganic phosphate transporter [Streptosporangium roseum]|uniref:inorganic phosphate transporter n=1 Tax=Streptosporangium roseum TaxID=2001 RepID=UPI001E655343|nr:inorganic phosphate transporter [Streptosporangium roseum]